MTVSSRNNQKNLANKQAAENPQEKHVHKLPWQKKGNHQQAIGSRTLCCYNPLDVARFSFFFFSISFRIKKLSTKVYYSLPFEYLFDIETKCQGKLKIKKA